MSSNTTRPSRGRHAPAAAAASEVTGEAHLPATAATASPSAGPPAPPTPRLIRAVLVANRGEIACRVLRTCRAMGIRTVAVFSDADADARHVAEADEAIRIGPAPASASYLNIAALVAAARRGGVDAVHPGYGFLAESAAFARACQDAGLAFVGPAPEVIVAMGSKREARRLVAAAGVPVVPGYDGAAQDDATLTAAAAEIGYPLLVKASAGGGGKGMRTVRRADELPEALASARREAQAAFGDATLLLERLVSAPRHIEVQIFGDTHGQLVQLGLRECTLQRRHQKVIEETPPARLAPALAARIAEAALTVGRVLGYTSAGTVEFVVGHSGQSDGSAASDDTATGASDEFYFLEVNTRLQVEHPITELVTGLDLVRWQILVAEGRPLPLAQDEIRFDGHAIEARLLAEDPAAGFLPQAGTLALWRAPGEHGDGNGSSGVRVDAGVRSGERIPVYYDSLLAKLSAWGPTRQEAIRRLDAALGHTVAFGLPTNRAFLRRTLLHPAHLAGTVTTAFIEQHLPELTGSIPTTPTPTDGAEELDTEARAAVVVALARLLATPQPRTWRNNRTRPPRDTFILGRSSAPGMGARAAETGTPRMLTVHLAPVGAADPSVFAVTVTRNWTGYGNSTGSDLGSTSTSAHTVRVRGVTPPDLELELDGRVLRAVALETAPDVWETQIGGEQVTMRWRSPLPAPHLSGSAATAAATPGAAGATGARNGRGPEVGVSVREAGAVVAPMPGQVVQMLVAEGQTVTAGQPLVILEAMKMEQTLRAPQAGTVAALRATAGQAVPAGAVLLVVRGSDAPDASPDASDVLDCVRAPSSPSSS